jgi:hypothetical protein
MKFLRLLDDIFFIPKFGDDGLDRNRSFYELYSFDRTTVRNEKDDPVRAMNFLSLEISSKRRDLVNRSVKAGFVQVDMELFTSYDKKAIQPYDGMAILIED